MKGEQIRFVNKLIAVIIMSFVVLVLTSVVSNASTTIKVCHVKGTSLYSYVKVANDTTISSNDWANLKFRNIAINKGELYSFTSKTLIPTNVTMYAVSTSNSNNSTQKSFILDGNIKDAWETFGYNLSGYTIRIYMFYDIQEDKQPNNASNNTLKVYIDYVQQGYNHESSYEGACASYTDKSKIISSASTEYGVGTHDIYVARTSQNGKASGCCHYVGPNKALHVLIKDSYGAKNTALPGFTYNLKIDANGNVTVTDPPLFTQYWKEACRRQEPTTTAKYTISQLGGELHFVVECSVSDDDDDDPPTPQRFDVEPTDPPTPRSGETRTDFKIEHIDPFARAKISSDEQGNEKYNNLHVGDKYYGIPTSETQYCSLEMTFNMFRLAYQKIEGKKFYDVTVETAYEYPKDATHKETYTVQRVYRYERNYIYYTAKAYDAYQLIRADVVNKTLTNAGRITMYQGDLTLPNGVRCPGNHKDAYNGGHMVLTLNGTIVANHMNANSNSLKIRLTRQATSKQDARQQAADDLGVSISVLGANSDIKNLSQTNSEIATYHNDDENNKIWKEANDKTVLTVSNDEIYHGRVEGRNVYLMEASTTSTNNAEDVAETRSPAQTAEQNVIYITRSSIRIPSKTVSNNEYESRIEGYYRKADDSMITDIRQAGIGGFTETDIPFLKRI